jgi:hypothetical protein
MSALDYFLRDFCQVSEDLLAFGLVVGGLYMALVVISWLIRLGKK